MTSEFHCPRCREPFLLGCEGEQVCERCGQLAVLPRRSDPLPAGLTEPPQPFFVADRNPLLTKVMEHLFPVVLVVGFLLYVGLAAVEVGIELLSGK